MSEEIKVQPVAANRGITAMRSASDAMPTTFAEVIEGENNLDMVEEYNEIKKEFDELLSQFENVFRRHVQTAEKAIEKYQETDEHAAKGITMRS